MGPFETGDGLSFLVLVVRDVNVRDVRVVPVLAQFERLVVER